MIGVRSKESGRKEGSSQVEIIKGVRMEGGDKMYIRESKEEKLEGRKLGEGICL